VPVDKQINKTEVETCYIDILFSKFVFDLLRPIKYIYYFLLEIQVGLTSQIS